MECDICFKVFSSWRNVRRHKIRHKEKNHKCSSCDKTYQSESLLRQHILKKHESTLTFVCNLCSYETQDKFCLQRHKITQHTRDFSIKCDLCDKGYLSHFLLSQHKEVQHEGMRLVCEFCSKTYKDVVQFQLHVAKHNPDHMARAFPCQVCFKVLRCQAGFKKHMKRHRGELENFVCDTCGIHVSLNIHVRRHTGERPYKCELCSEQFISKAVFNTHKCSILSSVVVF